MRRLAWYGSSAFVLLLVFQPLLAGQEARRVLILHSEDKANPAQEMTERGIREGLRSNEHFEVEVYTEYLDASRFGDKASIMADLLRRKYSGVEIHAILTVFPYAADFLLAQRLFPETPLIAAVIPMSYAESLKRSPARRLVTGTIAGDNLNALLDTALRLRPGTKRVALVSGTAPSDAAMEQLYRAVLRPYTEKLDLIDLTKLSMEQTLSRVGSLPPETFVMYSSILKDGTGKVFVPPEALSLISKASNAPVLGFTETYLGFGIVGGQLISFKEHGREAAALVLRVMGAESPASIPFGGGQAYVSAYDWRELKRWGISETSLPPEAEIRYRIPSFWEEYRVAILGVATLLAVETALLLGLLFNFKRRRKAERSLLESEERVRLAASSAGAGLWSADLTTGGIWATDRTRELFDFAPEDPLTYERMLNRIHPADRERVRLALQQAVASDEESFLECRILLPDGNVRWISYRGRLQQDLLDKSQCLMGACVDITARKLAEETLRRRENELMTLTGRLIHTQEEGLRRLSRDLHDDLTQRLAALAIDAGMLEKTLRPLQPHASEELAELKTRLKDLSDEVHTLSRQLHPSILDDLGLVQAIRSECELFSLRAEIAVSFESVNLSGSIPKDIALCLYRVLQEGLQNISKHSGASEARVVLQGSADGLHLSIEDSGIGFDVKEVAGKGTMGLSSMRERVRLVGGRVSIVSEPGKGAQLEAFVPLGGTRV